MLFNIAAMQSGIAAQQSVESDEGLKVAAKLYQVITCLNLLSSILKVCLHITGVCVSQQPIGQGGVTRGGGGLAM